MSVEEKDFKIKFNVLRRTLNELKMYQQEVSEGEQTLAKMAETHDRYRQLTQALEESKSMVLNATTRAGKAKADLEDILEDSENFSDNGELKKKATECLKESAKFL
eukprot:maker-scaffold_2-snap-gene-7.20-mRNA-1 protein AED:0.00 eAED:0.00 QI:353/1/1/1/1/1/2/1367/105